MGDSKISADGPYEVLMTLKVRLVACYCVGNTFGVLHDEHLHKNLCRTDGSSVCPTTSRPRSGLLLLRRLRPSRSVGQSPKDLPECKHVLVNDMQTWVEPVKKRLHSPRLVAKFFKVLNYKK